MRQNSRNVLVPAMYVGCSSEICTKAVSLCSYFITMCCICQVLFPINFRFFIFFSVLFVFLPIFWCESPFFTPQIDAEIWTFAELFLLLPIKILLFLIDIIANSFFSYVPPIKKSVTSSATPFDCSFKMQMILFFTSFLFWF